MYLYCVVYQGVDQEEYGGAWELLKEGMMTAFAMFMVYTYDTIFRYAITRIICLMIKLVL